MIYRKEIDGLRALAVIPVILFHAGFTTFGGGFVGVDIFFVISGYLITSIIVTEIELGSFSLIAFYERRARRIIPALFLVMLCTLPFAWLWMLPEELTSLSRSLVAVPLFASNVLFWLTSGYFDSASELKPLLHTWSLAVEEQFYVVFPMFLMLAWKLGRKVTVSLVFLFFIAGLAAAEWGSKTHPSFAFYSFPTRSFEILVGSLTSLIIHDKARRFSVSRPASQVLSLAGMALILFAIFSFDQNTPSPSLYTLVPTIGTSLILVFANGSTLVGRFLSVRFLVIVGLCSYSSYLWHQPLLAFARLRSIDGPPDIVLGFLTITAVLLGYLSWKYVENPFRNRYTFDRMAIFMWTGVGTLFFVTLGLVGHFTKGFPRRLSAATATVLLAAEDTPSKDPKRNECHFGDATFPTPQHSCVLGNRNNIRGALLGDSHAYALSAALANALQSHNLGFLSLTYSGCPPVKNTYRRDAPVSHKCFEYNEQTFAYLLTSPDIHFVVLSARWTIYLERTRFNNTQGGIEGGNDAFVDVVVNGQRRSNDELVRKSLVKAAYRSAVESLLRAGKIVFLIYPVPEVGWDVPLVQGRKMLLTSTSGPVSTSYQVFQQRNGATLSALNSIPANKNLVRVRPDVMFCDSFVPGRCVTQVGSNVLYADNNHLSNKGAEFIVRDFMQFLK